MVEACRQRLWNSLIRFYVCLNVFFTSVQSRGNVDCSMPKWGITYMGSRNVTKTGKACQAWLSESPHPVSTEIKDEHFPDGSKEEAENFCRNPNPTTTYGVWCYTTDPDVEWDYCDPCPGAYEKYPGCTLPDKGQDYRGDLDHSQSYMECDLWSKHPSSQYNFPDGGPEEAKNYCRNPAPRNYEAPWCFVKGMPGLSWDYCDVCKPFQGELKAKMGGYNKGSTKIAAMNRLACIRWCITWLTCLAVAIPHGESGSQCWYFTYLTGSWVEDRDWDQFNVIRICNARAEGREGYFVELPQYPTQSGWFLLEGSVEECDKSCIANPDCVNYDRYAKMGKCYYHYNIDDRYFRSKEAIARHLIRCVPSLKPPVDISDITDNSAFQAPPTLSASSEPLPQPSEEPLTDLPPSENQANYSAMTAESGESTDEPEEKKGLPMVAIVGAAVGVIVVVGGGFAYYKLVYKKGKKDSPKAGSKDERQKLTPKKSSTSKSSKKKKNLTAKK